MKKQILVIGIFFTLLISMLYAEEQPAYRIGAGDVLEIKFFDNQRFDREVIVRPDGRITLEKVGDIYVAGKTGDEVDRTITELFRPILKVPDVTIFINHCSHQKVYVSGEVNMPGGFALERDMSLIHALTLAGGPKRSAKLKSVILIRRQPDGTMQAERINVKNLFKAKPGTAPVTLQALDMIYVPKTFIANLDGFINQFFDLVLPPVDVFWRLWFIDQMNRE